MKTTPQWKCLLQSPLFAPLHPVISRFMSDGHPSLEELNALLASYHVTVQSGRELRFVEQGIGRLAFEQQYEPRCYLTGEVQTRTDNWHDLFNALVWLTYPKSKAAINARHYQALTDFSVKETASQRGVIRDTSTLLDESGVIVVYASEELASLLVNFQWTELFWNRRAELLDSRFDRLGTGMGFYLFGHGLYEKALNPYVGMTGQGLLLPVEQEFFTWPQERQHAHLDKILSDYLVHPEHCRSTQELTPVPLLGVPGWSEDNDCAVYYDNTAYFRAGRRGSGENQHIATKPAN